jgi:hypothetical protein
MPGNVTGSIGADNVNLSNAATESTLAALLKIAQIDSKNLIEIAKKAFPDIQLKDFEEEIIKGTAAQKKETQAIVQNTQAIEKEQEKHNRNIAILNQLDVSMTKLMDGTFQVSDAFGAFKNMPGILGVFAQGLEKIASIQEQNFIAYQKITDVGINFGGSLTQMRQAAANSYLTLEEFGSIVKANGQSFARMGGSANEGAISFSKASKVLMDDFGSGLMAMGYTSQEVNQGMIDYIAITGGRNSEEMKDKKGLASGTKSYLEELDRLADITGKSREEIAKEMKSKAEAADIQLYMASMSKEEAEKFQQVYNDARTKYGQGAADNVLAAAQGRAVTTEAGKKYAALAPAATESLRQQLAATQKYGKDSEQARKAEDQARVNNSNELGRYSGVLASATGITTGLEQAFTQSAKDRRAGMDNMNALEKAEMDRKARRAEIENSQATTMANAMSGFKELGASLWSAFSPLISVVTMLFGVVGFLAKGFAKVIDFLGPLSSLLAAYAAYKAIVFTWEAKKFALKKAQLLGGGVMGAAGKLAGGGGGGGAGPLDAIGKAAGGGIGPALQGLATGLTAFGPAQLIGATFLAGSLAIIIAGVGAGIAATMALIGLALPTFSTGLKTLSEVDTSNFGGLALGLGGLGLSLLAWGPFAVLGLPIGIALTLFANGIEKLSGVSDGLEKFLQLDTGGLTSLGASLGVMGIGLMSFAPFAIFGIPAAMAINSLADGVSKLSGIDAGKLELVASALQKVKDAAPSAGEILRIGIAGMVSKAVAPSESTTASPSTGGSAASADSGNNVASELKTLNNMTTEMLKVMKENLEYMKRSVSATKSLSGDLLKF